MQPPAHDRFVPEKPPQRLASSNDDDAKEKDRTTGIDTLQDLAERLSLLRQQRTALTRAPLVASWPRALPAMPSRILDAPGVLDDYFLNALDWGVRGQLAIGLQDSVYVWDAESAQASLLFSNQQSESDNSSELVTSLGFGHDGRQVACGSSIGLASIWDVQGCKRLRCFPLLGGGRIAALSWSRHLLSLGNQAGTVETHDVRSARSLVASLALGSGEVCGMQWSPDGRWLASGTAAGLVSIHDRRSLTTNSATNSSLFEWRFHGAAVKALGWSPTASGVLATGGGSADRHLALWDVCAAAGNDDDPRAAFDAGAQVSALVWSRRCRSVIAGISRSPAPSISFFGARCRVTCPALEHEGSIAEAHARRILKLAVSPDGGTLVSMSGDETLRFWRCWDDPDGPGEDAPGKCDRGPHKVVLVPPSMHTRARHHHRLAI